MKKNEETIILSSNLETLAEVKNSDRRDFLKTLGLAIGGAALAPSVLAAGLSDRMGLDGRRVLDRLMSPSDSLILEDRKDGYLYIRSRGLPDHITGEGFHSPIQPIQNFFRIEANPKYNPTQKPTPINDWLVGIAVNGVVLDPTGPYFRGLKESGYQFEVLSRIARPLLQIDFNNAHTQPSGEYHYHGMPAGLHQKLLVERKRRAEASKMLLLGYAADGFPIYAPLAHSIANDPQSPLVPMVSSYRLGSGRRASGPGGNRDGSFVQDFEYRAGLGHLDECNGRFGVTPEFPQGTYHYFLTYDFPFIPRYWKGKPDPSFAHPSPGVDAVPPQLLAMDFSKL